MLISSVITVTAVIIRLSISMLFLLSILLIISIISEIVSKKKSKNLFDVGYNAIQNISQKLFSDMKMKNIQMRNIDAHKILRDFSEHVAERIICTLQGPTLKIAVSLNLLSTLFHRLGP